MRSLSQLPDSPPVSAGSDDDARELTLRGLGVSFGENQVVENLSLDVRRGEFVTMVGPSGCGKSTTLNAIAGLLGVVPGSRQVGTVDIRDGARLAYAFQRDALLPWATARRNVEVGAELAGVPKRDRGDRARELLSHVGLFGIDDQYPHQLSGGMRQRVALARALAYQPDLFLLDEPFGALDAFTRMDLQNKLLELWAETKMTMVLVTHDLAEALVLGTKVVVLDAHPGRVHEIVDNDEWGGRRKAEEMRTAPEFLEKYRVLFDTLVRLSEASRQEQRK